jgi:hypothetical protein
MYRNQVNTIQSTFEHFPHSWHDHVASAWWNGPTKIIAVVAVTLDRLCGLVVRVSGNRSGGPGSIPGTTRFSGGEKKKKKRKTVVGLERGPLSLVSTTEELLDRKVAAPV